MKKQLFLLSAAVATLFAACSSDEVLPGQGDTQQVTFSVQLPEAPGTRAISDGENASRLYYAVFDTDGNQIDVASLNDDGTRKTATVTGKSANVTISLVKGASYKLAFWAQNAMCDAFDLTDLKAVKFDAAKTYTNSDVLDAFFGEYDYVGGDTPETIVLRRPFAQVNLGTTLADWTLATDLKSTSFKTAPGKASGAKYVLTGLPNTLNLLDGTVSGSETFEYTATAIPDGNLTVGSTDYKWLMMQYVLTGADKDMVDFAVNIFNGSDALLQTIPVSNLPIQRNYRTNIVGRFLTGGYDFHIEIDPIFATPDHVVEFWDGTIAAPATATENPIIITSPKELAWVSDQVAAGNTFSGKTIQLANDLDLNNQFWTPIGTNADNSSTAFQGTFDGNGKTIKNLRVDLTATPAYRSAGLFGATRGAAVIKNLTIDGATVKNLITGSASSNGTAVVVGSLSYQEATATVQDVTVKNAVVEGNRLLGGIAGYGTGTITGCTVDGITLTDTPDNLGGSYDNGDKAGGIIAYINSPASTITDNTVKNFTIKGYRDLGGIVGCGNLSIHTVTGNSATDGSITVDQTTNSYGSKTANANAVVGRILGGALDASNGSNNVTITDATGNAITEVKDASGNVVAIEATVATTAGFQSVYKQNVKDITITLAEDIALNFPARETWGGDDTETIVIDGGGKTWNLHGTDSDWSSFGPKNGSMTIKNVTINKTEPGNGAWNNHSLNLTGKVECENVTFNNSVSVADDSKFTNCRFVETGGYYTLWVKADVNNVTVDGCTFTATTGGRGIKIGDQYIAEANRVQVNLTISNTTFTTAKKAAVLVTNTKGAKVTASNVNIDNVDEDNVNLVWVDEDRSAAYDLVEVTGCTKKQE